MRKYGVLAVLLIFITTLFTVTSCEQSTSTTFEESFQDVKQVTPIAGAQDTKMDLQLGDQNDSFFTVTLNDGSTKEGWCIEWNENASFGVNEGTKLYSTKGHEDWKELNYFMGIKDDLRANDPELTYREIQVVIWSLIDKPEFDVDKIGEYENISERIYKDGAPLFDVQKVKDIVNQVNTHFSTSKSKVSDYNGVYLIENNGQTIMVGDETAYAYGGEDYASCFLGIPNLNANNWGWTNGPLPEGKYEFPIYAGAGQCNLNAGTLVGKLLIDYSNGTATVKYQMTEISDFTGKLYTLLETHLYIGEEEDGLLPKNGNKYTSAPGQFGNVDENHDNITEFTYNIPNLEGKIWVAAHSVVSGFNPNAD